MTSTSRNFRNTGRSQKEPINMFTGFNGDFRRKPIVSIRGESKTLSKAQVVANAQKERQKREVSPPKHFRKAHLTFTFIFVPLQIARLEHNSAVKIQSQVRSFVARSLFKKHLRAEFDAQRAESAAANPQVWRDLTPRLILFFDVKNDQERLVSI